MPQSGDFKSTKSGSKSTTPGEMEQDWLKELNRTREELRKIQSLLKASTLRHQAAEQVASFYVMFASDIARNQHRLERALAGRDPAAHYSPTDFASDIRAPLESWVAKHHRDAPKMPAHGDTEFKTDYTKDAPPPDHQADAMSFTFKGGAAPATANASQIIAILKLVLTMLTVLLPLIEPILNPPSEP